MEGLVDVLEHRVQAGSPAVGPDEQGRRLDAPSAGQVGLHDACLAVGDEDVEPDGLVVDGDGQPVPVGLGKVVAEAAQDVDVELGEAGKEPGRVAFLALAQCDGFAAGCQEQARQLDTAGDEAGEVLVGELLADQVQRQPGGPDRRGAVQQGLRLDVAGELRPAGKDGLDPGHPRLA